MRKLIDLLISCCRYAFYCMLWLAIGGLMFILAVAVVGGPMLEKKIFFYISVYTLIVFAILCIYLWVDSK